MAIRIIRKDEDPILRKKAKTVEKIDDRVKTLLEDMKDTMYDADGVGLAATQVGVLKRIILVDVGQGLLEMINPEIVETCGEEIDEEGCLSLPGVNGEVSRPEAVTVKGLNPQGQEIVVEAKDLFARALCHEIDHLNGVLFTDRIIK
ncbi:peptide deformylase [Isachenkonia alkalipeptolytica]|uniref:Peptide deformylase n=1 Tax=Isachenkonia alkalipeptolytica TaxID=2565777 RepID=A0AA43XLS9_9CLOT|nr:peptide deformylase [Isachenkonia alkalipeptolytica]